MSLRQFRPRRNTRRGLSNRQSTILFGLTALAIAVQIYYPLAHGQLLRDITLATVYLGASAMLAHAYFAYGLRYLATYAILTFSLALPIEILGSKTGYPFGDYTYDHSLGFAVAGVPFVVPFAWMMMAHPILIAARRVTAQWTFLYGGAALMAWDLFLDPQMVSAHRWSWVLTGAHVPFEPEIPLSNAAGWLFAGMGLIAILHQLLPKERRRIGASSTAPDIFIAWTLLSGIIGNLFFFHRPGVALFAGFIFGALLAPYYFSITLGRPDYL